MKQQAFNSENPEQSNLKSVFKKFRALLSAGVKKLNLHIRFLDIVIGWFLSAVDSWII